jgi:acyl-CoA dehydrogenase
MSDNGVDDLEVLSRAADELFADFCAPETLRQAEHDGWHHDLWAAVNTAGFTGVSVPERFGGEGGTDQDGLVLLRSAGRRAAPIPLAESGFVAGWLLSSCGLDVPSGVRTVIEPAGVELVLEEDQLSGTALGVPWARNADWIVALVGDGPRARVVLSPGPAAGNQAITVRPNTNLAGEPRDTVTFNRITVTAIAPAATGIDHEALMRRGAAARAAQIAGALTATADLVSEYTTARRQFGRPLRAFQAVQAHLVTVHQQAALVNAALDGVLFAGPNSVFEVAALKVLANQAATVAARAAHQAHGAMGMTQEYPLHLFTRRLWAWRNSYGDNRFWASQLGAAAAKGGPDALYSLIQQGSEVL